MAMRKEPSRGKRTRRLARKTRRAQRLAGAPPATLTVTFRHVEPSPALHDYAQRKLAAVAKFVPRPCEMHLILTVDKYRQHGEVTVKSGRFAVTAQEETRDLYSVIDLLVDKVGRQLRRSREKIAARKTRARSTGEVLAAVEESESGFN
jgi:putative sigma-54 modulation protein